MQDHFLLALSKSLSEKDNIVGLKSWIEQKQFMEDGKCKNDRKCSNYKLAFQTGKRVGCSFREDCPGKDKIVTKCFYCSNTLGLQRTSTVNLLLLAVISFTKSY